MLLTRDQMKHAARWRGKAALERALSGPTKVRDSGRIALRGYRRITVGISRWLRHVELRDAISEMPKDKQAPAFRNLADRKATRMRIFLLVLALLLIAGSFAYSYRPVVAAVVAVCAFLLLCEIAGWNPDEEEKPPSAPEPLKPGTPIRVLQDSITDILKERCGTKAIVVELRTREDGCGWTGRLVFPATRADDDTLIEALEQGLMVPARSISLVEDPANRAHELITINLTNPLANPGMAPKAEPMTQSVLHDITLGVPNFTVNFTRTNIVMVGKTRSGKTGGLRVMVANLINCPDARVVGIDLSDGPALSRFAPCLSPYATTHAEAHKALQDAVDLIAERTKQLKRKVAEDPANPDDHTPTAAEPQVIIAIDEFSRLAENACCLAMVKEISVRGAKAAVNWVICSQTGTKDDLGNPVIRDSAAVTVLLSCSKMLVPLLLGDRMLAAGWRPDRLEPAQGDNARDAGTCFVWGAGHTLPVPQRFYGLPSIEVSRRAAEILPYMVTREATVDAVEVPQILMDACAAFGMRGAIKMSTAMLLEHLSGHTARSLAEAMKPYGVKSVPLKIEGKTLQGYELATIESAIEALD